MLLPDKWRMDRDRQTQDQTLTEGGSNPLVLQKPRKGKCGHTGTDVGLLAPDWV